MWAAGCIVLATPLPMVATRTALVAHTSRFFFGESSLLGMNYSTRDGVCFFMLGSDWS